MPQGRQDPLFVECDGMHERVGMRLIRLNRGNPSRHHHDEHERVIALEREVRELRQSNEVINVASAFFAQAEQGRQLKSRGTLLTSVAIPMGSNRSSDLHDFALDALEQAFYAWQPKRIAGLIHHSDRDMAAHRHQPFTCPRWEKTTAPRDAAGPRPHRPSLRWIASRRKDARKERSGSH